MVSAFERLTQADVSRYYRDRYFGARTTRPTDSARKSGCSFQFCVICCRSKQHRGLHFSRRPSRDKINPAGVNITHGALGYESAAMIYGRRPISTRRAATSI